MIINIDQINGWEKDSWKITTPGNYAHFIAKNKHDSNVQVFLTDPGGRGDNWKVNVGIGSRIGESKNACGPHTSFDDKDTALLKAATFMKKNPALEWDENEYPKLTKPDGGRIERP